MDSIAYTVLTICTLYLYQTKNRYLITLRGHWPQGKKTRQIQPMSLLKAIFFQGRITLFPVKSSNFKNFLFYTNIYHIGKKLTISYMINLEKISIWRPKSIFWIISLCRIKNSLSIKKISISRHVIGSW